MVAEGQLTPDVRISVCSFLHREVAKLSKAFRGEDRRMKGGLNLRVPGLGSSFVTSVWGQ